MDANTKPDEQNAEDEKKADANDEKRSYYYDDAHGYEIYRAEDDDEEVTDDE